MTRPLCRPRQGRTGRREDRQRTAGHRAEDRRRCRRCTTIPHPAAVIGARSPSARPVIEGEGRVRAGEAGDAVPARDLQWPRQQWQRPAGAKNMAHPAALGRRRARQTGRSERTGAGGTEPRSRSRGVGAEEPEPRSRSRGAGELRAAAAGGVTVPRPPNTNNRSPCRAAGKHSYVRASDAKPHPSVSPHRSIVTQNAVQLGFAKSDLTKRSNLFCSISVCRPGFRKCDDTMRLVFRHRFCMNPGLVDGVNPPTLGKARHTEPATAAATAPAAPRRVPGTLSRWWPTE